MFHIVKRMPCALLLGIVLLGCVQEDPPDESAGLISSSDSMLSKADRDAIGAHIRPCWYIDGETPAEGSFHVQLVAMIDSSGTVHAANISPADQGKLGDPIFNAFAQRAISAVTNPQCATLPLPKSMLGQNQTLIMTFRP